MISIPYTAYAAIYPAEIYGDKWVKVKSRSNIATIVTEELKEAGFVITHSDIANTPRFGTPPRDRRPTMVNRLTIVGFDNVNDINFQPATRINIDAPSTNPNANYHGTPGKVINGYRGTQTVHPHTQSIDPRTRTHMLNLKSSLESTSSYLNSIYRIDYMGIIFGEGGYSFQ